MFFVATNVSNMFSQIVVPTHVGATTCKNMYLFCGTTYLLRCLRYESDKCQSDIAVQLLFNNYYGVFISHQFVANNPL